MCCWSRVWKYYPTQCNNYYFNRSVSPRQFIQRVFCWTLSYLCTWRSNPRLRSLIWATSRNMPSLDGYIHLSPRNVIQNMMHMPNPTQERSQLKTAHHQGPKRPTTQNCQGLKTAYGIKRPKAQNAQVTKRPKDIMAHITNILKNHC